MAIKSSSTHNRNIDRNLSQQRTSQRETQAPLQQSNAKTIAAPPSFEASQPNQVTTAGRVSAPTTNALQSSAAGQVSAPTSSITGSMPRFEAREVTRNNISFRAESAQSTPLNDLVQQNPNLRTNQDLINHFYDKGQGSWEGAQKVANEYGVNMNDLTRNRQGAIDVNQTGTPSRPSNPTTPAEPTNPTNPSTPGNPNVPGPNSVIGAQNTTPEFRQKVSDIAGRLGMDPKHLMAVMSFETGGRFTSDVRNPVSGATGLIQFMPSTARGLGTSTSELARMSPMRQLDYVERYLTPYKGKMNTVEDAYMAVLWPAAVGRGPDHNLFSSPSIQYRQNAGLDSNGNGHVTAREAAAKVRARML